MRAKFYIQDWAGNDKTDYYGEFNTAEDAWDRLMQEFDDDAWLDEFYVEKRGAK